MRIFVTLMILFLASCSSTRHNAANDYSEQVVGTWNHNYYEGAYGVIEYSESGDKCEMVFEVDPLGKVQIDYYWNKWKIEDGVIHTVMIDSNTSLRKGKVIRDKIIVLNEHEYTVEMIFPKLRDVDLEHHYKSKHSLKGKVCQIVQQHLTRE